MLDRERADFFRTLESLQSAFGSHVVATEIPIGAEHEVSGVIDLIDMRAYVHEGDGRGEEVEAEIPEELAELADEYREKLMDEVAENSDSLMERYLEGDEISHEETVDRAQEGRHRGPPVPGHLRDRDPQPRHRAPARGAGRGPAVAGDARARDRCSTATGRAVEVEPDEDGELIAQAFKTTADPYTGRVNMVRVLSGTLRSDSHLHNLANGAKERVGQLGEPHGKELEPLDELGAGDIGAVAKLKETAAGDVLCEGAAQARGAAARAAGAGHGVRVRAASRRATRRRRRPRSGGCARRTRRSTSTATRRPASRSSPG